jgi:uncharacterized membrane protein
MAMTSEKLDGVSKQEQYRKKFNNFYYIRMLTTALVAAIVPIIFMIPAFADAGTDAMGEVVSLLETYVPIIGGVVAFVGILMFAQSFASQDADRKAQAGFVVAAGGMIAAAGGLAGTLMGTNTAS